MGRCDSSAFPRLAHPKTPPHARTLSRRAPSRDWRDRSGGGRARRLPFPLVPLARALCSIRLPDEPLQTGQKSVSHFLSSRVERADFAVKPPKCVFLIQMKRRLALFALGSFSLLLNQINRLHTKGVPLVVFLCCPNNSDIRGVIMINVSEVTLKDFVRLFLYTKTVNLKSPWSRKKSKYFFLNVANKKLIYNVDTNDILYSTYLLFKFAKTYRRT